ncbi:MAG: SlyX family protein [Gammaproteobacteria bacterium]|nr:SlyX family protein [Gammaproteobacteria bacterium]
MNDTDLIARLESLETRLMHQEASLDEITRTLLGQEQLVNRQLQAIKTLQGQLQSLTDAGGGPASEEPPPPHY